MLEGWSWWQIVATVGVVWTASSFLIAFALARVLRANLAFDVDSGSVANEPNSREAELEEEDSGAEWVGPTAHAEPSLLDQLLPADLAEDGPARSSGTRFRPVTSQGEVETLRRPRRIG
jgi:hypothetical protein